MCNAASPMLTDYTTGKHLTKREFGAALKPASMLAIRSYDVLLLRRVLATWVVRDICELCAVFLSNTTDFLVPVPIGFRPSPPTSGRSTLLYLRGQAGVGPGVGGLLYLYVTGWRYTVWW